jgi:Cysteine rich repeat
MMLRQACLLLAVLIAGATPALAQPPFPLPLPPIPLPTGTPEERAACQPDVQKFCEQALPDTMRVLHCLQANRTRISRACRQVLERHGQ